jgi:diguanylate cyclase (GGDEF)-like protein/putative nucleotidyltransferase with HDIG domain
MARAAAEGVWNESEILDTVPDALFVLDGDWNVVFVNGEAERLLRRPAQSLLGRLVWDVYPDICGTIVEREFRRASEQQREVAFVNEYEPLESWFSVRAAPLRGGLLVTFHDVTGLKRVERKLERLSAEKSSLHRIADVIARQRPPEELFELLAHELAMLFAVEGAGVLRHATHNRVEVVGSWARYPRAILGIGGHYDRAVLFGESFRTTDPTIARIDRDPLPAALAAAGRSAILQVPVTVEGEEWGVLLITSERVDAFDEQALERAQQFADLLSVAIANAESRERMARMAATDPLSGLPNHRIFHERMRDEIAIAARDRSPLSIAVLGLDRFRDVNDMYGHLAGDAILAEAGARLADAVTPGQLLARIGGDEFGLIMPGREPGEAQAIVERARAAIASRPFGAEQAHLTASAGVADLATAGHGELLFACADGAHYWAKLHGRDMVCVFHPALMNELSPADRAEAMVRGKTLAGITALARAIDAKDPLTRRHSERVAWLAELLARECGWREQRVRALHEAALVHDIGKIGIPDEILLHDGRLTDAQYELIKTHAPLGAEIVEGVLMAEQVDWVRSHHERPDGRGYPQGLTADGIPEGAALLSVADVLDVMTISRPYSQPIPLPEAVAEMEGLVGAQFMPKPIEALRRLYESGALREWDVGPDGADGR